MSLAVVTSGGQSDGGGNTIAPGLSNFTRPPRPTVSLGSRWKMAAHNEAAAERSRREASCGSLLLRRFPPLAHCSRLQMKQLLKTTRVKTFSSRPAVASEKKSNVIVKEGDVPSDDPVLMMIASGSVDVYMRSPFLDASREKHPQILLTRLGQGDELGAYAVCGKDVGQAEMEHMKKTITYEPSPYTLVVSPNSEHKADAGFEHQRGGRRQPSPAPASSSASFQKLIVYTVSLEAFRNLLCSQPMLYEAIQTDVLTHLAFRKEQRERNAFSHTSIGGFSADRTPFALLPSTSLAEEAGVPVPPVSSLPSGSEGDDTVVVTQAPKLHLTSATRPASPPHAQRGKFDLHPGLKMHKFSHKEIREAPASALPPTSTLARILNQPDPPTKEQAALALPPQAFTFNAIMKGGAIDPTEMSGSTEEKQSSAPRLKGLAPTNGAPTLLRILKEENYVDPMTLESDSSEEEVILHGGGSVNSLSNKLRPHRRLKSGQLAEAKKYISPEEAQMRKYMMKQRAVREQQMIEKARAEAEQYERDLDMVVRKALAKGLAIPTPKEAALRSARSKIPSMKPSPSASRKVSPASSKNVSPAGSRRGSPRSRGSGNSKKATGAGLGDSISVLARLMQLSDSANLATHTPVRARSRATSPSNMLLGVSVSPGAASARGESKSHRMNAASPRQVPPTSNSQPSSPRSEVSNTPSAAQKSNQLGLPSTHTKSARRATVHTPSSIKPPAVMAIVRKSSAGASRAPDMSPVVESPLAPSMKAIVPTEMSLEAQSANPPDTTDATQQFTIHAHQWPNKSPPFAAGDGTITVDETQPATTSATAPLDTRMVQSRTPSRTPSRSPSRSATPTPPPDLIRNQTPEVPRSRPRTATMNILQSSVGTSLVPVGVPSTAPPPSSLLPPPPRFSDSSSTTSSSSSESDTDSNDDHQHETDDQDHLTLNLPPNDSGNDESDDDQLAMQPRKTMAQFEAEAKGLLARAQARVAAREKAQRKVASQNANARIAALRAVSGQGDLDARSPTGSSVSPSRDSQRGLLQGGVMTRRFSRSINQELFSPSTRQAMQASQTNPGTLSRAKLHEQQAAAALAHHKAQKMRNHMSPEMAAELGLLSTPPLTPLQGPRTPVGALAPIIEPGSTPNRKLHERKQSTFLNHGLSTQVVLRPTSSDSDHKPEVTSEQLEVLFRLGSPDAQKAPRKSVFKALPSDAPSDLAALQAFSQNLSPMEAVAAVRRASIIGDQSAVPIFTTPTRNSNGQIIEADTRLGVSAYAEFFGGALNAPADQSVAAAQALAAGVRPELLNADIAHRRRGDDRARKLSAVLSPSAVSGVTSPMSATPKRSSLIIGTSNAAGGRNSISIQQKELEQNPINLLGYLEIPTPPSTTNHGLLSPPTTSGKKRLSFSFGHAIPPSLMTLTEEVGDAIMPDQKERLNSNEFGSPSRSSLIATPMHSMTPMVTPSSGGIAPGLIGHSMLTPSRRRSIQQTPTRVTRSPVAGLPSLQEHQSAISEDDEENAKTGRSTGRSTDRRRALATSASAPTLESAMAQSQTNDDKTMQHSMSSFTFSPASKRISDASEQSIVPFDVQAMVSPTLKPLAADHRRAGTFADGSRLALNTLHPWTDVEWKALRDRVASMANEARQRSNITLSDIFHFQGLENDPAAVQSGLGLEHTVGLRATQFIDHRTVLAGLSKKNAKGIHALSILLHSFSQEHPVYGVKPRKFKMTREMSGEAIQAKTLRARRKARKEAKKRAESASRPSTAHSIHSSQQDALSDGDTMGDESIDFDPPPPPMSLIISRDNSKQTIQIMSPTTPGATVAGQGVMSIMSPMKTVSKVSFQDIVERSATNSAMNSARSDRSSHMSPHISLLSPVKNVRGGRKGSFSPPRPSLLSPDRRPAPRKSFSGVGTLPPGSPMSGSNLESSGPSTPKPTQEETIRALSFLTLSDPKLIETALQQFNFLGMGEIEPTAGKPSPVDVAPIDLALDEPATNTSMQQTETSPLPSPVDPLPSPVANDEDTVENVQPTIITIIPESNRTSQSTNRHVSRPQSRAHQQDDDDDATDDDSPLAKWQPSSDDDSTAPNTAPTSRNGTPNIRGTLARGRSPSPSPLTVRLPMEPIVVEEESGVSPSATLSPVAASESPGSVTSSNDVSQDQVGTEVPVQKRSSKRQTSHVMPNRRTQAEFSAPTTIVAPEVEVFSPSGTAAIVKEGRDAMQRRSSMMAEGQPGLHLLSKMTMPVVFSPSTKKPSRSESFSSNELGPIRVKSSFVSTPFVVTATTAPKQTGDERFASAAREIASKEEQKDQIPTSEPLNDLLQSTDPEPATHDDTLDVPVSINSWSLCDPVDSVTPRPILDVRVKGSIRSSPTPTRTELHQQSARDLEHVRKVQADYKAANPPIRNGFVAIGGVLAAVRKFRGGGVRPNLLSPTTANVPVRASPMSNRSIRGGVLPVDSPSTSDVNVARQLSTSSSTNSLSRQTSTNQTNTNTTQPKKSMQGSKSTSSLSAANSERTSRSARPTENNFIPSTETNVNVARNSSTAALTSPHPAPQLSTSSIRPLMSGQIVRDDRGRPFLQWAQQSPSRK